MINILDANLSVGDATQKRNANRRRRQLEMLKMASVTVILSLILLASAIRLASPSIKCSDLMPANYDVMKAPCDGSNETIQVAFQPSVMNIANVNVQDQVKMD